MKYILIILFVLCSTISLQASDPYYYFKQISIKEGLPSSVITIYDDEDGFLWIGTIYGAYRFDGEKLIKLRFADGQQTSPYIYEILSDNEGCIWVFSNQGVSFYNTEKDVLEPLLFNGQPVSAYTGLPDKDHFLLSIKGELLRYDKQTKRYARTPVTYRDNQVLLLKMQVYDDNYYLGLDATRKLILIDRQTGATKDAPFDTMGDVWDFYRDTHNRYWLSFYGEGISCYSSEGKLIDTYTLHNSNLNNTFILDIEEHNGQIWLATDGGGINIIHPDSRQITILSNQNNYYFPTNSATCLSNGANNMWVGMVREGVLGAKENFITTYSKSPINTSDGMSEKCPLCLIEDEDGIIWIGTDGGGVNSFNPQTEEFTHYPATAGEKIVSLCPFSKDELLISNYLTGVHIFNKKTGTYRKFTIVDKLTDASVIGSGIAINLFTNRQGEIEFHGKVHYRYIKEKNQFTALNVPSIKYTNSWIYIGEYGSKPYFHNQDCIFSYNHQSDKLEPVYESGDHNNVIAACIDSTGTIWIANRLNLSTFNVESQQTKVINLPDNNDLVTSLATDRQGTIWMGTPGALYSYSPKQERFIIFSESDGVIPNDFLPKPVLNTRNDDIYMGGATGLVRVKKSLMQGDALDDNLRIKLLDVRLNGSNTTVHHEDGIPALEIAHNFTQLEIHTKLDGTDLFRKRIYRYQIIGLNNDYTESSKPYLKLPTLSPGDYQISVHCTLANGQWSEPFTLLQLTILPPWWQRAWFITLIVILALSALAHVIHLREEKIQRRLKEKERQIYKDKVQALININHELRTPLTLIYSPLKQLLNSKQIPLELRNKLLGAFKQTRQMKNIINMILNIRRMEVGQYTLCPTPTLLNEWLEGIISDFRSEFAMRDIALLFKPDAEISTIPLDRNQCEIIISNLLTNAYKFSPPSSVVTISTSLEEEHNRICIEVCDQGIGLGNEDPKKLFTRFQRGHHNIEGNGIGLSYAKQLVEMHGGQISAENNKEIGATFRFTLPISGANKDADNNKDSGSSKEKTLAEAIEKPSINDFLSSNSVTSQDTQEPLPQKYHSILIVESDPDLLDFMAANLQSIFEHTYTAHDGMEALPIIVSQLPQLVISDVSLPRINGLELCRKVKQNQATNFIPVILLAPDVDEVNAEGGYKTGADAYVTKPFDIDLLMAQAQAILRNRNIVRQRYQTSASADKVPNAENINHLGEQFVIQLNRIITDNLSNAALDVNMVAKLMHMSRASLYNKMKATMGIGVNEYITKKRIEYAKSQLTETNLSIGDISEKAGFLHSRNFSALFKAAIGCSPSDYRKKSR